MLHMILFDLKRVFRGKLLWFVMVLLLVVSIIIIQEIDNKKTERVNPGYTWGSSLTQDDIGYVEYEGIKYDELVDLETDIYLPKKMAWNKLRYEGLIALVSAADVENGNLKYEMKWIALFHLLEAKLNWGNDELGTTYLRTLAKPIFDSYNLGVAYDDVDPRPPLLTLSAYKYQNIRLMEYYNTLYKMNYKPINKWDVNTHTYMTQYLNQYIPILIGVIALLFTYNAINKEKAMGSLKLILNQGKSRRQYYIAKWLSHVICICLAVVIPCSLVVGTLALMGKAAPLNYPVLGLENGMERFKPIPNYLEIVAKKNDVDHIEGNALAPMPPETEALFADYDAQVHPQVHWMSYSKYILTTLLLNLLYIAFIVAFVLLISAFVDNQPLSFVVSAVLFLMATLLNRSYTMGLHWNLSPFGMNNGFRIVNGSYNVTPLMACAVLCVSTFLLLTIGSIYFKKKGI